MLTDDLLAAEENVENMKINTGERNYSNGKLVLLIKGGGIPMSICQQQGNKIY